MKILFVNPPVIRTKNSNAKNNFKIDGLRFRPIFRKIPFIYPIWKRLSDPTTRYGVRAGSRWPWTSDQPLQALHYPFLMAYATSLLKENGFEVELYDAVAQEEYSYSNFISNVSKKNADIIVIETSTPTFDIDIWMAKKLSKFADICLAGPHLTYTAEKLQKKHKFIKYFLKGEYILSALEMAKTKRPGIYEINTVKDLEEIPYPYRDYPEKMPAWQP